MRYATAALMLSIAGCNPAPGAQGPAGAAGERGEQGMTGMQGTPGTPGKDAVAQKIPHLVVTSTGEDLGPSLGDTCAYNESAGGQVCFDDLPTANIYFDQPDCKGPMSLLGVKCLPSVRYYGVATFLRPQCPINANVKSSYLDTLGKCNNSTQVNPTTPLIDTGIPVEFHSPSTLAIELR